MPEKRLSMHLSVYNLHTHAYIHIHIRVFVSLGGNDTDGNLFGLLHCLQSKGAGLAV